MKNKLHFLIILLLFPFFCTSLLAQGEEGPNDIRLTNHGPDGNIDFDAFSSSIGYNSTNNEFLLVYHAGIVSGSGSESEIHGQRYNANTGAKIGTDFRISQINQDGLDRLEGFNPQVAYNSTDNNYLVVWEADSVNNLQFQVYCQIVAADGSLPDGLGNPTRIGTALAFSGSDFEDPKVAYNSTDNNFLVSYHGRNSISTNNIFGRLINANGTLGGPEVFITANAQGSTFNDREQDLAYNSTINEYLIAYRGQYTGSGNDYGLYAQRISANVSLLGSEITVHIPSSTDFDVRNPRITYNPTIDDYFVVWTDERNGSSEREIYGQPINADGTLSGTEHRISFTGTLTDNLSAGSAVPAYSPIDGELHIAYQAEEVNGANEIYMTVLNANDYSVINSHTRISDMGNLNISTDLDGFLPSLTYNTTNERFLVIWNGEDDDDGTDREREIYGQFWRGFQTNPSASLPVELASLDADRINLSEVELRWSTASELNNKGFHIERMLEHETEFKIVGFVNGEGTTTTSNYYELIDLNAYIGVSYYRLKQEDYDGSTNYSEIKAVRGKEQKGDVNLSLYPNPVSEKMILHFENLPKSVKSAKIEIIAINGQVVYTLDKKIESFQSLEIDFVKQLVPAIYELSVELDNGEQLLNRFIKK